MGISFAAFFGKVDLPLLSSLLAGLRARVILGSDIRVAFILGIAACTGCPYLLAGVAARFIILGNILAAGSQREQHHSRKTKSKDFFHNRLPPVSQLFS